MIKQGYVYENLMINLRPSNIKPRDGMIRIVSEITGLDGAKAFKLLADNGLVIRRALEAFYRQG